jgi:hypothetical protein
MQNADAAVDEDVAGYGRLNSSHSFCKMQMRQWMKTLLDTV